MLNCKKLCRKGDQEWWQKKKPKKPKSESFALTDQRSDEVKRCHHLKNSVTIKNGVGFSAGVKHHHCVPNPKTLDSNPKHIKYCHQASLLRRLIQLVLVRSLLSHGWNSCKSQGNLSRQFTYAAKTRSKKWDSPMGGLNIGLSWGVLCLVTSLLHLKV